MAQRPFNAREIGGATRRALVDDVSDTAFAIFRNLVVGSPVGNPALWQNPASAPAGYVGGHFRRNWIVSLGGFTAGEIEGVDMNGATTIAQGKREIDQYKAQNRLRKLVIQNNVPYANRLAQGWSRQAEAGWVDNQIDAGLTLPGGTKVVP